MTPAIVGTAHSPSINLCKMAEAEVAETKQPAVLKEPRSYQLEIFQEACNRNVSPLSRCRRHCACSGEARSLSGLQSPSRLMVAYRILLIWGSSCVSQAVIGLRTAVCAGHSLLRHR